MAVTEAGEGSSSRGLFLVLEGVEGAGKSTQVRSLSNWMEGRGVTHLCTREPGGTPLGEALRTLVLDRTELDLAAESELFLILAARAAFVRDVVRPALARGEVVVADRYDLSTYAYQGWGRGLDLEALRAMSAFATGGLRPDLYVVLDVPVDEGSQRQLRQGKSRDRFEGEGAAFLTRVRDGYVALAASDPDVYLQDATGSVEAVHEAVTGLLDARFPETFRASRR
jgi:dTMP kinase